MDKYLYLLIDLLSLLFPLLFSFHPKLNYHKKWKYIIPSTVIVALLFLLWDVYYTHLKVWGFNERYITGVYFFNLPIEEVLFFICIPYSSIFIFHIVEKYKPTWLGHTSNKLTNTLIIIVLIIGLISFGKLYTSVTFILLGITLFIINKYFIYISLNTFLYSFLFILIPFFIVNGILTGAGIEEEVVFYDNNENLGIRILTIPVEDTFYGMLMLLLNVSIYKFMEHRDLKRIN